MGLLSRTAPKTPPAAGALPAEHWGVLNRLRFHASLCRADARLDLFEACALIDPRAASSEETHMRILLRVLGQALGTRPVLYRPGERDLSFDERWLIACLDARIRRDEDSFAFLLHSRIERSKRRTVAVLLSRLAEALPEGHGLTPPDQR